MKTALKVILPLLVLALGLTALGLLIMFRKPVQPRPTEVLPPLVESLVVSLTNHQFRVETQGTVQPRTRIQLSAEVSGKVMMVSPSFDAGGFFRKDDVLFRIQPDDFEAAVVRAEAQVAEAKYRLEFERAEASVARREWENLAGGDPPSALLLREPQVAQAEAALASAQAALDQARRDLQRTEIKAPFDGRVSEKNVDVGQFVTKGSPVARIYSVDIAEVRLPLSADQLAFVDVPLSYRGEPLPAGGPVVLLRGQLAGQTHTWTGRVDRTEGEIDTQTRMITVVAQVEDPYGRRGSGDQPPLAVGLFVLAEILGKTAERVAVVPRAALRGQNQVLIVDDETRLRFRDVQVLRADRAQAVIGSGLSQGERICTSPLDVVTDGMRVRLQSAPSESQNGADASPHQEGDGA